MLAFHIEVDGERWLLAGHQDQDHLLLQLSAFGHREIGEFNLDVHSVFGLDKNGVNNARWVSSPKLAIGSKVTITLVDADNPDAPHRCYRYDREVQESPFTAEEEERMEREEWLRLKAKFGPGGTD